jgi:hypothetical protein
MKNLFSIWDFTNKEFPGCMMCQNDFLDGMVISNHTVSTISSSVGTSSPQPASTIRFWYEKSLETFGEWIRMFASISSHTSFSPFWVYPKKLIYSVGKFVHQFGEESIYGCNVYRLGEPV